MMAFAAGTIMLLGKCADAAVAQRREKAATAVTADGDTGDGDDGDDDDVSWLSYETAVAAVGGRVAGAYKTHEKKFDSKFQNKIYARHCRDCMRVGDRRVRVWHIDHISHNCGRSDGRM